MNFSYQPYQPYQAYQPYQQYRPMQNDAIMQYQQPQVQQNNSILWVNSEAEAQSYLVAPNNAVALWDQNAPAVYLKQTDPSGKPTFKAFDLVERTAPVQAQKTQAHQYVTREEFEQLRSAMAALMKKEEPHE